MKMQLPKYTKTINWGYHKVKQGEVPSSTYIMFYGLLNKPSVQKITDPKNYYAPPTTVTYDTGIYGGTACKESSVYNMHNDAGNAILWHANEKKTSKTVRLYDASSCIALIQHFEKLFGFKKDSTFYQIGEANAVVMEYAPEWKQSIFASSILMQLIRGGAYYNGDLEKFIRGTYCYRLQDKRHLKTGERLLRKVIESKSLSSVGEDASKMMFVSAAENAVMNEFVYEKLSPTKSFIVMYDRRLQTNHGVFGAELIYHEGKVTGINMVRRQ